MNHQRAKYQQRLRRRFRVSKRVRGTPDRPRLCIFRTLKHMYAQVIDDQAGKTLVAASTIDMTLGPDGSTVTGLTANDRVQVNLPADANTPAREIHASTLNASGGDAGLQSATFGGGVQ